MYKVCIVDDEIINYQLLEKMVNWEEKGFQIVGTAGDGIEALQMYEQLMPDLIFMDIKLPLMDGLECVRCIREENKQVQIVMVSAYGDFSYAQKAIRYGVQDFLLKPVSRLLINQLVDNIKKILDARKQISPINYFQNDITMELQQMLYHFRRWDVVEKEMKITALFSLDFLCRIMVTTLEGNEISDYYLKEMMNELVNKQEFETGLQAILIVQNGSAYIGWNGALPMQQLIKVILDFFKAKECRVELYAWREGTDEDTLPIVLKKMADVTNYGFYEKKSAVYSLAEYPFIEQELELESLDRRITESFAEKNPGQLLIFLENEFQRAGKYNISPKLLKNYVLDVLLKVKFSLSRFDKKETFTIMRNVKAEEIQNILYSEKLWEFVEDKIQDTFVDLNAYILQAGKGKNVVFQANAFTELHYGELGFSVQKVAEHIGISKNYFTSLYKEKAGINFWDHVMELRMQKAKEYLLLSEDTIGTIARQIGYESEYHFSRKFKEYTGISPNQFRKHS